MDTPTTRERKNEDPGPHSSKHAPTSDYSTIKVLSAQWPGPSYWSLALRKQGSVIILFLEYFDGKIISWSKDSCSWVVSLLLDLAETRANLVNIYAHANLAERKTFFDKLHQFFIPSDVILIGSDFNCYKCELDKFGGNFSVANYLKDF